MTQPHHTITTELTHQTRRAALLTLIDAIPDHPTNEIRHAYALAWYQSIGMNDEDATKMADTEAHNPMPWRYAALTAVLTTIKNNLTQAAQ